MTIKQVFPRVLIILGLVSIFLVGSMPVALAAGEVHTAIIRQADSQGGLAVRDEPSPEGEIIAYLPAGSEVAYEGEANNGWIRLSAPASGGWVDERYLGSRSPEASVIGIDNPEQCLRVRKGPGINYEKIGCLPKGAKVNLTGTVQKDWAQIVEPMAGWVTARQIQAPGLFPAEAATSGGKEERRGSSEHTVQYSDATQAEYSDQPTVFPGQPLERIGAENFLGLIQKQIQRGASAQIESKPGGAQEQKPQPAPAQEKPTTTETKNPDGSTDTVTKNPDGSTNTVRKYPNGMTVSETKKADGSSTSVQKDSNGKRTAELEKRPDGSTSHLWGYDPKTGALRQHTEISSNGIQSTEMYSGSDCSRSAMGQCKKTYASIEDTKNRTASFAKYGPDGRMTERGDTKDGKGTVLTCDAPGKCPPMPIKALGKKKVTDQPKAQELNAGVAAQAPKDKAMVQDPNKLKAGIADQLKASAKVQDAKGGANKLRAEVLGQIEGKPSGSVTGAKERLLSEYAGQFKKQPGERVGLNPQPLPPTPKVTGAKKKLLSEYAGQVKKRPGETVGLNPQPLPPKAMSGRVQNIYKKAGEAKSKVRNWDLSAGSSGGFRTPRQ